MALLCAAELKIVRPGGEHKESVQEDWGKQKLIEQSAGNRAFDSRAYRIASAGSGSTGHSVDKLREQSAIPDMQAGP